MPDILHRIGATSSSPEAAYDALTTLEGLANWWACDTTGRPDEVGGVITFRFVPGSFDMKVLELVPAERVRWEVVDGPPEWMGTQVIFDIGENDGYTIVRFEHRGWVEPLEFMGHCSTKWATYMLSLKQMLETGTGAPDPDDVKISDWH